MSYIQCCDDFSYSFMTWGTLLIELPLCISARERERECVCVCVCVCVFVKAVLSLSGLLTCRWNRKALGTCLK